MILLDFTTLKADDPLFKVIYTRTEDKLRAFWGFYKTLAEAEEAADDCFDKMTTYYPQNNITILIYDREGNIVG